MRLFERALEDLAQLLTAGAVFDLQPHFIGRLVRVKTSKPIRGLHVIVGRLKQFEGGSIVVTDAAVRKDPDYVIPMEVIKETRLEVEI